jgi:hypothetical protein
MPSRECRRLTTATARPTAKPAATRPFVGSPGAQMGPHMPCRGTVGSRPFRTLLRASNLAMGGKDQPTQEGSFRPHPWRSTDTYQIHLYAQGSQRPRAR